MLLLFAVVFGLSTGYGVFLLARIKAARKSGYSDSEAVAVGLERTGRIVTAAALLFCIAFGAFVSPPRPSLMQLLGRWSWWAPAPLRRLQARIRLSEA